jgi:ABC-type transport system substrate-binding protein
VDKLLEQGQQDPDMAKRIPFYLQAQIQILEDAASIPIWGKRVIIGAKKSVQGMNWTQNIYPIFFNTYLTK